MGDSFRFCGHESHLGEVSVFELLNFRPSFLIPSYQRGYRWQGKQVKALLDDLYKKWENIEPIPDTEARKYLLQPIVLQKHSGDDNDWLVVDGQQRLTTLRILIEVLCEKGFCSHGENIWTIGPEDSTIGHEHLSEACRENAHLKIENYPADKLKRISEHLCDIVLIYLCIEPNNESTANDAFERLNAGKIALTDSELIRALYLHEDNEENQYAKSIAAEWEQIEAALKDDAFWFMFNDHAADTPTRIDRLFRIITGQENKDTPRAAFWSIEAETRDEPSYLDDVWNRMLNLYWMLRHCFNDIQLYHYVGWLCHRTDLQFKNLYNLYECNRPGFKVNLQKIILGQWRMINNVCGQILTVFQNVRHLDLVSEEHDFRKDKSFFYLHPYYKEDGLPSSIPWEQGKPTKTVYDKPRDIVDFLLIYNLELLNQRKGNIARFSFKMFNNQAWDIEHIASHDSQDDDPMNNDMIEQRDKNRLPNLALLDASINRQYQNKPFREKRKYILGMVKNDDGTLIEAFMPPGTLDVFSKNYTEEVKDMEYWYRTDFDAYNARMIRVFTNMWNEAFPEA